MIDKSKVKMYRKIVKAFSIAPSDPVLSPGCNVDFQRMGNFPLQSRHIVSGPCNNRDY
jgi:hypothetical protein